MLNALKWHPAVQEEKIKVSVENGIVKLDGEVEWEYQRKSAKTAIEYLMGVKEVINLITIKPVLSASNIEKKITDAFQRNASIDAKKITVNVDGNKVILTGTVRSFAEKDDAENAAWAAPGVLDVDSKIKIDTSEYVFYE